MPYSASKLNKMNLVHSLLLCILISRSNCELRITTYTREGNNVRLQCREHLNGDVSTVYDKNLFLFNETGQRVISLLEAEDIDYRFNEDDNGELRFEMQQRLEGYYYCGSDQSAGLPNTYKTLLGKPVAKQKMF